MYSQTFLINILCTSQVVLSPQREGILRGGKTARLQSPFVSGKDVLADSSLASIQAFPFGSHHIAAPQFVHGGSLSTTGLALGINDDITSSSVALSTTNASDGQSGVSGRQSGEDAINGNDIMKQMRQLFSQQQDEVKRTIETAIAQHVQPLNSAIAQERTERTQAISSVQGEIADLRAAFEAFTTNPNQQSRENLSDEVVVGGFGQKSKDGAISLVQLIIEGKPGEPWVIRDKVGQVPKVVPIKFASRDHAELFIREHSGQKTFPHKYESFWRNIRQTPEEQEKIKRYVAPLFKAKRAICECLTVDGARVVINKNDRKVFYVEGMELKPICEMTSNGMMQWSPTVVKEVRDRYTELTASR